MHVIEVAPLMKGVGVESLSYYSSIDYPPGTLLTVPVRNKEIRAVVLNSTELSAAKTAVRAATFSLKRLPAQANTYRLSSVLVNTAKELSKRTPSSFGVILFSMLPLEMREGDFSPSDSSEIKEALGEYSVSVLTGSKEERYLAYKRRIREAFAHRGSVIFVSPTAEGLAQAAEELMSGIEDRSVILSNALPKRALKKSYQNINDLSTAKLILATPSRSIIDRPDITDIIIDESSSSHYKMKQRPYINFKDALLIGAKICGRRALLGDLVHRSEDESLRRSEIFLTEEEEPHRINLPSQLRIIDQSAKVVLDNSFKLFSDELLEEIKNNLKNKQNVFLYAARRGLSPVVTCGDCGFVFRCPDSGSPYSLFSTMKDGEEKRWFVSPTSGRRVRAADTCPQCNSWRLRERGIGIQHIHNELRKLFPEDRIFIFDHLTASTKTKARSIIGDFYEKKGAILLGTSMALPFIEKPVALSAIVSLDAVRSVPTWRVDELSFSLLMRLREISTDTVIVQSRTESDELMSWAATGSTEKFFDSELALRKALHYPPFYKLIHLTIAGSLESVRNLEAELLPLLEPFGFAFYSAPDSVAKKTVRYGLSRVAYTDWPDKKLLEVLRNLPPSVRIEIDPERIV